MVSKVAVGLLFLGSALLIPILLYLVAQQGVAETAMMVIGAGLFLCGAGIFCMEGPPRRRD
jgi:hypothetical protein